MSGAYRYAVYLAPPPDTALWQFGSHVLGYDAATGRDMPGFVLGPHGEDAWAAITERPRTYGFHATLKAPFRLAENQSREALVEAMVDLAKGQSAFDPGPMAVTAIGHGATGFVALTMQRASDALAKLEHDTVRALDAFRAPATEKEIAARKPEKLTPRQRENLAMFGYPYIGPDFRFHMTLSGEIAAQDDMADAMSEYMANTLGPAHMRIDALVLFEQATPGARFRITDRFALSSAG